MIEFLRQWIINIVIVSIFIALLEAILPNNSFRGYIKMVSGFLMIIVLLNPFIKLISNNISIDKEVFANVDKYNEVEVSKEKISISNEDQIKYLYKDKVKKDIVDSIESNFQYTVKNIEFQISGEEESYGQILDISIAISETENNNMTGDEISIENIQVSNDVNGDKETKNINYDKLIKYIYREYKIPLENIKITQG